MAEENHGNNFFHGLILGAVLGAGLYYFLTATKEGEKVKNEFRKRVKDKSEEAFGDLNSLIAEIEEKGEDFRQKAAAVQQKLEAKVKGLQGRAADGVREELDHIQALRERGRKAVKVFTRNGKPLS